jgi:hypothetical protein
MSVADCRAARRRNRLRYGEATRRRSLAEAVERERKKAEKFAKAKAKRK